jgi:signal transduction histidine kinase
MLHADIRQRPSAAIETIAYFCVAELLANVARHSGATLATVDVTQQIDGGLRIRVGDNGQGGARLAAGHGLAGLSDRLRTVDGRLGVDSPPGGPTAVTVELPSSAGPGSGPGS